MTESRYIYGFHDPGGEYLMLRAGKPGWVLITEAIGHNPTHTSGRDYRLFADAGLDVIVRLNNGYYLPHTTTISPHAVRTLSLHRAAVIVGSSATSRTTLRNDHKGKQSSHGSTLNASKSAGRLFEEPLLIKR